MWQEAGEGRKPTPDELRFDGLVIRPRLRLVERGGVPVALTAAEFDLLLYLASHPRHVFTREELLHWVWHYDCVGDTRAVTVQMSRLRMKVEANAAHARHLRTVWGVGYKFTP